MAGNRFGAEGRSGDLDYVSCNKALGGGKQGCHEPQRDRSTHICDDDKALVFGLVLLPPPIAPDFLPKLTIFVALASIVAVIWGLIGRLTQVGARSHWRLMILQRTASGWLAIVSCTVVASLFQS